MKNSVLPNRDLDNRESARSAHELIDNMITGGTGGREKRRWGPELV